MADAVIRQGMRSTARGGRLLAWLTIALYALELASSLQPGATRTAGSVAHAAETSSAARLRDPMQAPTVLSNAVAPPPGTNDARGDNESAPQGVDDGQPRLASIRRPAQGPARALINGQWVGSGAVVGNWRVRAIGADSVVLQSTQDGSDTKVLALHQFSIRRLEPAR